MAGLTVWNVWRRVAVRWIWTTARSTGLVDYWNASGGWLIAEHPALQTHAGELSGLLADHGVGIRMPRYRWRRIGTAAWLNSATPWSVGHQGPDGAAGAASSPPWGACVAATA